MLQTDAKKQTQLALKMADVCRSKWAVYLLKIFTSQASYCGYISIEPMFVYIQFSSCKINFLVYPVIFLMFGKTLKVGTTLLESQRYLPIGYGSVVLIFLLIFLLLGYFRSKISIKTKGLRSFGNWVKFPKSSSRTIDRRSFGNWIWDK